MNGAIIVLRVDGSRITVHRSRFTAGLKIMSAYCSLKIR